MGLFDWFKKSPTVPLPQLCYDVAYFVLPHYAFEGIDKLVDLCLNTPALAGPFFYVMAAQMRKVEPVSEDAKLFRWHHGLLSDEREYFALEYPLPPAVNMSNLSDEQAIERMTNGDSKLVLAPYFSAIIRGAELSEPRYFILGQSPLGGGTTLRCITPEGLNCNLGPGPEPDLASFLEAVECIA